MMAAALIFMMGFAVGCSLDSYLRTFWKRRCLACEESTSELEFVARSRGSCAAIAEDLGIEADGGDEPAAVVSYAIDQHIERQKLWGKA